MATVFPDEGQILMRRLERVAIDNEVTRMLYLTRKLEFLICAESLVRIDNNKWTQIKEVVEEVYDKYINLLHNMLLAGVHHPSYYGPVDGVCSPNIFPDLYDMIRYSQDQLPDISNEIKGMLFYCVHPFAL